MIRFNPIRGKESAVFNRPYQDGNLLFAEDTGKIYLDANDERILMGSNGVALFYGHDEKPQEDADSEVRFILTLSEIEDYKNCREGDLVLNQGDGSFYKIEEINESTNQAFCLRLSVSGSGGGGSTNAKRMTFTVTQKEYHSTIINGHDAIAIINAKSATDDYGEALDEKLTVTWTISEQGSSVSYAKGTFVVDNNVPYEFNFGAKLQENSVSVISFQVTGIGSGTSTIKSITMATIELTLKKSSTFSNLVLYNAAQPLIMSCDVSGNIKKILYFIIDGEVRQTQILEPNQVGTRSATIGVLDHGYHTARLELYSYDNDIQGSGPEPLEFEFAYVGDSTDPIIWLGDFKEQYYSYDKIQIPYMVYDPSSPTAEVLFYKGSEILESKTTQIKWDDVKGFNIFEITDATVDAQNVYTILCGTSMRNVTFEVVVDPKRDMTIKQDGLILNFDAAGRSNKESSVNRTSWSFGEYKGDFIDFNWYNNGWVLDKNNNSCLRISNGAKFNINLGNIDVNTSDTSKQSCTFEFEFKIKNIQDYSNIIKEITRYKGDNSLIEGADKTAWEAFNNQSIYSNYDSFLNAMYDETTKNVVHYIGKTYDELEFDYIYKKIDLKSVFCNFYSTAGLCLGPQDGFFSTGNDTVNVKYVEDKTMNLSMVFDYSNKLILIYLNGVLSSIAKITSKNLISLKSATGNITFSSDFCDVDLYKFRVYNKALNVKEISTNYAVDHKNILLYDQSEVLALPNSAIGEYQLTYEGMINYNNEHEDNYLMPYLIIDSTNSSLGEGVLPYSKAKKAKGVHLTFVNTGLDHAYANGLLGPLAEQEGYKDIENGMSAVEQYYMHHCPSWTSQCGGLSSNAVTLQVQGTSSEFYPRRNYKAKTKGSIKNDQGESVDFINMFMNKGPFQEAYEKNPTDTQLDWFYYDNKTVGTTKFTLKIDYMESSGTYNMGLANFVANAYTKHPLNDYNAAGAFEEEGDPVFKKESVGSVYKDGQVYYTDETGAAKADVNATNYKTGTYYLKEKTYKDTKVKNIEDYRTSVQGFPVLAFNKNGNQYTFIGRYNMLLDKGSDEAYGFKLNKKILQKFAKHKAVCKIAECWEYSDNSRTYCSFRDPEGRDDLSFSRTSATGYGGEVANSAGCAPIVVDSFEYRYNTDSDLLDYLYDQTGSGITAEELYVDYPQEEYGDLTNPENRNKLVFDLYKHWEDACKWVYSTKTDGLPSQVAYKVATVTAEEYAPNKYYIKSLEDTYELSSGDFVAGVDYYEEIIDPQTKQKSYNYIELNVNNYVKNKYYVKNTSGYKLCDSALFDATQVYYIKDDSYLTTAKRLSQPVTYAGVTYELDTQEYRQAKFKAELQDHFDLEYCLVYFIMTEVLMCYDSRGKNCMMASWGPLKEGGNYVWYPIFYDMDTQLGINNTGIPSFEYYVNATEEGCFSTNDSILWMNLYKCFYPQLQAKYYALRGMNKGIVNINTGKTTSPFAGIASSEIGETADELTRVVDHIERWYLADPRETGSFAMQGDRPLIALNLDEYYKYISITNPKIKYQDRGGDLVTDTGGTYFYALQGDRSLSRQQFLHNRLNFIDSWWTFGDYARGGAAIWGRIGANDPTYYSDKWIEDESATEPFVYSKYYKDNGEKTNFLDADVDVKLTPYQNCYVAIGGDNGVTNSKQYNGVPVDMILPDSVVTGRKKQAKYAEQLFYIYGAKALQSIGDSSTLYWTEFKAEKSPKLQSIILGSHYPGFYNKKLNLPQFDAESTSEYGKPMLKEINLTGINVDAGDSTVTFDFTSSEKLEKFFALRSNIENVTFADGVSLDTLYLPSSIKSLRLTEARKLKNILSSGVEVDSEENYKTWQPPQGLYIENLTNKEGSLDSVTSNINLLSIHGGSLGYDSYKLLKDLYTIKRSSQSATANLSELAISITDADWTPYIKLEEGYEYQPSEHQTYYKDNFHYGLEQYQWESLDAWKKDILNGLVYKKVSEPKVDITDVNLLVGLKEEQNFSNTNTVGDTSIPEIAGTIFINNTEAIDEGYIKNTLQAWYPNLEFFATNVTKGKSARFIQIDNETGAEKLIATQKVSSTDSSSWFKINPYDEYGKKIQKSHWIFKGWSTEKDNVEKVIAKEDWASKTFEESVLDYTFYAVYEQESYPVKFIDGNGEELSGETQTIVYGKSPKMPEIIPGKDESELGIYEGYDFIGYSLNRNSNVAMNIETYPITKDTVFYALFKKVDDIRQHPHPEYFDISTQIYNYQEPSYGEAKYGLNGVGIKLNKPVSGKLVIPTEMNGKPVVVFEKDISTGNKLYKDITHIITQEDSELRVYGEGLMQNANNLTYIDIPKTLRRIEASAFQNCTKLQRSNFDANILEIRSSAFNNAFNLTAEELKIGGSIVRIDTSAFTNSNNAVIKTLVIGSAEKRSKIDVDQCLLQGTYPYAFKQNSGSYINYVIIYPEDTSKTQKYYEKFIDFTSVGGQGVSIL